MEPAQVFRHTISRFAFSPTPTRVTSRTPSTPDSASISVKDEAQCQSTDLDTAIKRSESTGRNDDLGGGSPKKKRRVVVKRGYAGPQTYAHLNGLTDHLTQSLDGNAMFLCRVSTQ